MLLRPARLSQITLRTSLTPLKVVTSSNFRRTAATVAQARKEGDISSVFVSLSGEVPEALPPRFALQKARLIEQSRAQVHDSWSRLLLQLKDEVQKIASKGPAIIPQIDYSDIGTNSEDFAAEVRKRGAAVVRGVIPESEAREYKTKVENYIKANPWTKGQVIYMNQENNILTNF
jgi:hypothetical protein